MCMSQHHTVPNKHPLVLGIHVPTNNQTWVVFKQRWALTWNTTVLVIDYTDLRMYNTYLRIAKQNLCLVQLYCVNDWNGSLLNFLYSSSTLLTSVALYWVRLGGEQSCRRAGGNKDRVLSGQVWGAVVNTARRNGSNQFTVSKSAGFRAQFTTSAKP